MNDIKKPTMEELHSQRRVLKIIAMVLVVLVLVSLVYFIVSMYLGTWSPNNTFAITGTGAIVLSCALVGVWWSKIVSEIKSRSEE